MHNLDANLPMAAIAPDNGSENFSSLLNIGKTNVSPATTTELSKIVHKLNCCSLHWNLFRVNRYFMFTSPKSQEIKIVICYNQTYIKRIFQKEYIMSYRGTLFHRAA